jgi:hypothetical protein
VLHEDIRERVTDDAVKAGQKNAEKLTLDDLFGEVIESEGLGTTRSVKIKMKNGRTLTTLVLIDGKWLAETVCSSEDACVSGRRGGGADNEQARHARWAYAGVLVVAALSGAALGAPRVVKATPADGPRMLMMRLPRGSLWY